MSLFDIPGYSDWSGGTSSQGSDYGLTSVWDAANAVGMNPANTQPRTSDTVPTSAIGSMQPIVSDSGLSGWGTWLQQGLGAVLGYGLTKDAVQSGVVRPVGVGANGQPVVGTTQPGMQYAQPQGVGGINLGQLLLLGGVVLLVTKLAK